MPSISEYNPRHTPQLNTHEATILGLADNISGSLLSSVDAFIPPQEKKTTLRDGIEFGAFTLTHLSTLLSELRAKVNILQDGYDRLQSSINLASNTLTSAICSLPDEILVKIMLYCSPSDGLANITARTRAWFPSALVIVSRKWRHLVYSSPKLWSSFQLQLVPSGHHQSSHDEQQNGIGTISRIVARHLTYSLPSPLTLRLSTSDYYSPHHVAHQQLGAHSERWEHLALSHRIPCDFLNEVCSHRLPKLRSLEIEFSVFTHDDASLIAFDDAPALQSLTLREASSNILSPNFPWHQLTNLTSYQFDPRVMMTFLSKAQNVVSLSLEARKTNANVHHVEEPNHIYWPLNRLRRLFINTPALLVLNHLIAPALEQLYIRGGSLCAPATDLLARSACNLTELTIVTNEEPHAIETLLAACPSLTVLNIQADYTCINAVYNLLSDAVITFVPHLRGLTLVYDVGTDVSASPFLAALHPSLRKAIRGPFRTWTPSSNSKPTVTSSSVRSARLPSRSNDEHSLHTTALATAIRARLTSLHSVSISNPITMEVVSTLLSFASQGIDVKILIGYLPEEATTDPIHRRREKKYGNVLLDY